MPSTETGGDEESSIPSPNEPAPQHFREPPDAMAQLAYPPAKTELTPLKPGTACGRSVKEPVVPLPSWPALFSPQHLTPPVERTTQTCSKPSAMSKAFAIPEMVTICAGAPKGPPQHRTVPSERRAQELNMPATIL